MPYGTRAASAPSTNTSTRSMGARLENVHPETTSAPVIDEFLPGCSSAPKNRSRVASAFARSSSAAMSAIDDARLKLRAPARCKQPEQCSGEIDALARGDFIARQQQTIAAGQYDAARDGDGGAIARFADDCDGLSIEVAVGIGEQIHRPPERAPERGPVVRDLAPLRVAPVQRQRQVIRRVTADRVAGTRRQFAQLARRHHAMR